MEHWKKIKGHEDYMVSDKGRVMSLKFGKQKIRKQRVDRDGYCRVDLSKNSIVKTWRTHSLVAEAFIPNPEGRQEVNHIDGNKSNNRLDNLEWCTRSENILHNRDILGNAPCQKLSLKQVNFIKQLLDSGMKVNQTKLASCFGIHCSTISGIKRNISWKEAA